MNCWLNSAIIVISFELEKGSTTFFHYSASIRLFETYLTPCIQLLHFFSLYILQLYGVELLWIIICYVQIMLWCLYETYKFCCCQDHLKIRLFTAHHYIPVRGWCFDSIVYFKHKNCVCNTHNLIHIYFWSEHIQILLQFWKK